MLLLSAVWHLVLGASISAPPTEGWHPAARRPHQARQLTRRAVDTHGRLVEVDDPDTTPAPSLVDRVPGPRTPAHAYQAEGASSAGRSDVPVYGKPSAAGGRHTKTATYLWGGPEGQGVAVGGEGATQAWLELDGGLQAPAALSQSQAPADRRAAPQAAGRTSSRSAYAAGFGGASAVEGRVEQAAVGVSVGVSGAVSPPVEDRTPSAAAYAAEVGRGGGRSGLASYLPGSGAAPRAEGVHVLGTAVTHLEDAQGQTGETTAHAEGAAVVETAALAEETAQAEGTTQAEETAQAEGTTQAEERAQAEGTTQAEERAQAEGTAHAEETAQAEGTAISPQDRTDRSPAHSYGRLPGSSASQQTATSRYAAGALVGGSSVVGGYSGVGSFAREAQQSSAAIPAEVAAAGATAAALAKAVAAAPDQVETAVGDAGSQVEAAAADAVLQAAAAVGTAASKAEEAASDAVAEAGAAAGEAASQAEAAAGDAVADAEAAVAHTASQVEVAGLVTEVPARIAEMPPFPAPTRSQGGRTEALQVRPVRPHSQAPSRQTAGVGGASVLMRTMPPTLAERSAGRFTWASSFPLTGRDAMVVQLCLILTAVGAFVAGAIGARSSVRTLCTWLLPAATAGGVGRAAGHWWLEVVGFHPCLVDTLGQMQWPLQALRVVWTCGRWGLLGAALLHEGGLWPTLAVLVALSATLRAASSYGMTKGEAVDLWEEEPVLRAMYSALKSPVVEAVAFQHSLEQVLVAPYWTPALVLSGVGLLLGVTSLMVVLLFPALPVALSLVWWLLVYVEMWYLFSPIVCSILNSVHWLTAAVVFRDQFPHRLVCDENPARVWPVLRRGLFMYFVQRSGNALRAAELTVALALVVAVGVAAHVQLVVEELWRFASGPQRSTVTLGLLGSAAVVAGAVLLLTACYIGMAALVNHVCSTHWAEFTNYCKRCSPKRLLDEGFGQQLASVKVLQHHDPKACLFYAAPTLGQIAVSGAASVLVTAAVLLYRTLQDNT